MTTVNRLPKGLFFLFFGAEVGIQKVAVKSRRCGCMNKLSSQRPSVQLKSENLQFPALVMRDNGLQNRFRPKTEQMMVVRSAALFGIFDGCVSVNSRNTLFRQLESYYSRQRHFES